MQQTARIDFTLQLGPVAESIEVTAQALLDTEKMLGAFLDRRGSRDDDGSRAGSCIAVVCRLATCRAGHEETAGDFPAARRGGCRLRSWYASATKRGYA